VIFELSRQGKTVGHAWKIQRPGHSLWVTFPTEGRRRVKTYRSESLMRKEWSDIKITALGNGWDRGADDAMMDQMENVPPVWSRSESQTKGQRQGEFPPWVHEDDYPLWLLGYVEGFHTAAHFTVEQLVKPIPLRFIGLALSPGAGPAQAAELAITTVEWRWGQKVPTPRLVADRLTAVFTWMCILTHRITPDDAARKKAVMDWMDAFGARSLPTGKNAACLVAKVCEYLRSELVEDGDAG
jgi:hypothetical protein